MNSGEIRRSAREFLAGKWGKAALLIFIYIVITFLIGFVLGLIPLVGSIISVLISLPLGFGIICSLIKLKRGEDVPYFSFFNDGFSNFSQVWFVQLRTILKLLPYTIGMIICIIVMAISIPLTIVEPGVGGTLLIISYIALFAVIIAMFPKSLLYALSQYILFDNPNKTALEIVEESEQLMRGNRLSLFGLQLSFIGWAILSSFTFGIGYLFLLPYMQFATIIFYEKLAGKDDLAINTDSEVSSDDYEIVGEENNYENETVITDFTNQDEE